MEEVLRFDVSGVVPDALEVCYTNTEDIIIVGQTSVAVYDSRGVFKVRRTLDRISFGRGVTMTSDGFVLVTDNRKLKKLTCDYCYHTCQRKSILLTLNYALEDVEIFWLMTKCKCLHTQEGIRLTSKELLSCKVMDNSVRVICDMGNGCLYIIHNGICEKRITDMVDPHVIAFTSGGDILIGDDSDNSIKILGLDLSNLSHSLKQKFRMDRPYGIALDGRDRILAADLFNHRVLLFDPQGHYLGSVIPNTLDDDFELRPHDVSTSKNADRVVVLLRGYPGLGVFRVRVYKGLESYKTSVPSSPASPNSPTSTKMSFPTADAGPFLHSSSVASQTGLPTAQSVHGEVTGKHHLKQQSRRSSGKWMCV